MKGCKQYDSIYINFKNKQNKCIFMDGNTGSKNTFKK